MSERRQGRRGIVVRRGRRSTRPRRSVAGEDRRGEPPLRRLQCALQRRRASAFLFEELPQPSHWRRRSEPEADRVGWRRDFRKRNVRGGTKGVCEDRWQGEDRGGQHAGAEESGEDTASVEDHKRGRVGIGHARGRTQSGVRTSTFSAKLKKLIIQAEVPGRLHFRDSRGAPPTFVLGGSAQVSTVASGRANARDHRRLQRPARRTFTPP